MHLPAQPAKVLSFLARNAGRLVTREEIRAHVWSDDTFVDFEQGLNFCIKEIRAALGDDARAPRFIETLPRRGYRFLARVEQAVSAPVPPLVGAGRATLVVLPFENLGGDAAQEYFSDGLTDEMIAQLARLSPQRLGVIARTSAMTYKHSRKTVAAIARELGVSYVVEGSVRYADGKVRISARLIAAGDQTQVWTAIYDRDLSDILRVQSELARAIADGIHVEVAPDARRRLQLARTVEPGAYLEYLKGRFAWNKRTKASIVQAIAHFERAAQSDPSLALAYAAIGDCYCVLGIQAWIDSRHAAALATSALTRALDVDASLAEPHAALGFIQSLYEYRWEEGEREFRRALDLNDNYATAHHWLAFHLAAVGRVDEAIDEIHKADALDPFSPIISTNVGTVLFWARQFESAIAQYQEVLVREPNFWVAHWMLGLAYEQRGQYADAVGAHRSAIAVSDGVSPVLPASLARALAMSGDRTGALRLLADLGREDSVSFFHVAAARVALDDFDEAARSLYEAHARGESWTPFIKTDARFDRLRGHPRYEELARLMRL